MANICKRKLLKRDDLLMSIFSLIIYLLQPTIKMVFSPE